MSATTAWKRAWRQTHRNAAAFARIDLVKPTARTVWAGTRDYFSPANKYWQSMIREGYLHSPGSHLTNDIEPCTGRLTLAGDVRLGWQTGSQRLSDAFYTHEWRGATVTIWYWELSLTNWAADAYQRFTGEVLFPEIESGDVVLQLRGSMDWNQPIQPAVISRETDPNAPEEMIGVVVPILYGAHEQAPWRTPWKNRVNNYYSGGGSALTDNMAPFLFGGRRLARAVLADLGRGAGKARVRVASHPVKAVADPSQGAGVYLEEGDRASLLEIPGGDVFNDALQGAGFLIGDNTPAWLAIPPEAVEVVANTADDFRSILEATDASFVQFDQPGGKTKLRVRFPAPENPGDMLSAPPAFIVAFAYDLNGGALQAVLTNQGTGLSSGTMILLDSTPTRPTTIYFSLGINGLGQVAWGVTPLPATPYDLGNLYLEITATAGMPRLYACSIAIKHRPTQPIVESTRTVQVQRHRQLNRRGKWHGGIYGPYTETEELPAVTEFRGKVFHNTLGWADDGSGTISGTANALLEDPGDLATHILVNYGFRSLAQIERGIGAHGSFVDARAAFHTWNGRKMKLALGIHEDVDVLTALAWITAASASWIFISPSDGKFRIIPWGTPGTTYDLRFGPSTVFGTPRIRPLPSTTAATGMRVPYGYDARKSDYLHEVMVRADYPQLRGQSSGGYEYFGIRDESLRVVASLKDRLDVRVSGVTTQVSLAVQDNDYASLYLDLKAKFNTATLHGLRWGFAFGGVRYAGANKIGLTDGSTFVITIPDGVRTLEEEAALTQQLIRAATGNNTWTVTVARSAGPGGAGIFTFARGSGAGTASLRFNDPAIAGDNACAGYGFRPNFYTLTGGTVTGEFAVEEQFFVITASGVFDLLHRTGPNGFLTASPRDAAAVLGMNHKYDLTGGTSYRGVCPKGYLEKTLGVIASDFDPKRVPTVEGRALFDTASAREMRNRVLRLSSGMPNLVTWPSPFAQDIERGQIAPFSADMDRILPYTREGSSGSWADPTLLVLETFDNFNPTTFATEIVAVELPPA